MSESTELVEEISPEEQQRERAMFGERMFVSMLRRLQLQARVPLFCAQRSWPSDDDFHVALAATVAFFALGANTEVMKRPASADALDGRWPVGASVVELFESLQLGSLLQDPPVVDEAG